MCRRHLKSSKHNLNKAKYSVLLLLCWAMPVQADWGRLFYTPQQRQQLQASAPVAAMPVASQLRRFNGELIGPRGKVQWLDGKIASVPAGAKPGSVVDVRK
ncbi:hypothetical protein [Deefgea piscis]|uniref:hypothetical protein n=1 Tax=Deefgea piscis TaxID=2739061 RepID=UPI001C7FFB7B|nr:hypothetical protein [Deefgea piscis]QZA81153.1 hypothetical protein K4H25_00265 [Deefgea piscis]